jgi:NitT/TauT family transport system substrate-binding protein
MTRPSRRAFIAGGTALTTAAILSRPVRAATPLKMILNWKYEGPQGYFFLAQDKGYFADEGIEVAFDQGNGSGAAVPQVANGAYDLGFGDINALIELGSKQPANLPLAVAVMYNRTPFCIAVKADSPIKTAADLVGKNIGGAANDGARKLFPAYCALAGIKPDSVNITTIQPNLGIQMMNRGEVDGVFGYITTLWFGAKLSGLDPETQIRFIKFSDSGLNLLSNSIIVSHALATEKPALVKGFLKAMFKGVRDTIADPDAAIAALSKREPLIKPGLERDKLLFTLHNDMADPVVAGAGLGAVDPARLAKAINIVVSANGLAVTPPAASIFSPDFLPPMADRPVSLP